MEGVYQVLQHHVGLHGHALVEGRGAHVAIDHRPLAEGTAVGIARVGGRQGESSLVEGAAPVSCGDYAVGDRVSHLKFGAGVIRRIETLASDHKLVVEFSGYGEKTLLAKFAKLTKL